MLDVDVDLGRLRTGRARNPLALKQQNSLQIICGVLLPVWASAPHHVILLGRIPMRRLKCKTAAPGITKLRPARLRQLRVNLRRIACLGILGVSRAQLLR